MASATNTSMRMAKPIPSMYGIFTYICHTNQPNVGKHAIHGSYGKGPNIFSQMVGFDGDEPKILVLSPLKKSP